MTRPTLTPVTVYDWPKVAAGFADLSFEQESSYAEAAARQIAGKVQYWGLTDAEEKLIAAAAVRIKTIPGLGRGIAWIASGPMILPVNGVVPDEVALAGIFAALRAELTDRQGHVLRLRISGLARLENALIGRAVARTGFKPTLRAPSYRSMALDLTRGTQSLMGALTGKWRTDLRFAQKSGLVLERGNGPLIEDRFLAMFEEVQLAKDFRPKVPPQFHFRLGGAGYTVETLIAVKDGKDVAGIVTGSAGGSATYLYGATTDAGRPLRAGYFLTWEAVCLAQRRGLSWYDLGGIDTVTNPDVARFKERMNGVPLLAEPFEACPSGLAPRFVLAAESLRARLKPR